MGLGAAEHPLVAPVRLRQRRRVGGRKTGLFEHFARAQGLGQAGRGGAEAGGILLGNEQGDLQRPRPGDEAQHIGLQRLGFNQMRNQSRLQVDHQKPRAASLQKHGRLQLG